MTHLIAFLIIQIVISYYRKISLSLENICNNGCGCSRLQFDPICGVDGITYYSPCYAGCYRETSIKDVKVSVKFYLPV